jgi:hypothetical protein
VAAFSDSGGTKARYAPAHPSAFSHVSGLPKSPDGLQTFWGHSIRAAPLWSARFSRSRTRSSSNTRASASSLAVRSSSLSSARRRSIPGTVSRAAALPDRARALPAPVSICLRLTARSELSAPSLYRGLPVFQPTLIRP